MARTKQTACKSTGGKALQKAGDQRRQEMPSATGRSEEAPLFPPWHCRCPRNLEAPKIN
ncbi:UNVERIFIED_CONTAM: hypothetical protein Sradi_5730300 [Sesamum radiatum]|uniref:Uncharacterized protein n=1 Tax=Sesamum radiatum TaxID=300843 RepID=A0AAW2L236_SESRA